jgi:hypothetical protein
MITLNGLETTLITFLGGRMQMVGFPVTLSPPAGSTPNPNTLQAINWACELLGVPVATYGSPTDADLAFVLPGQPTRVLADLSRLGLLQIIIGNWSNAIVISTSAQSRSVTFADHLKDMESTVEMLSKLYAPYLNPSRGGVRAACVPMRWPVPPRPGGFGYGGYGGGGPGGWFQGPRY